MCVEDDVQGLFFAENFLTEPDDVDWFAFVGLINLEPVDDLLDTGGR